MGFKNEKKKKIKFIYKVKESLTVIVLEPKDDHIFKEKTILH